MKRKNSVIVIDNEQLDWISRNPQRFVNGVVTRCEHGEIDPRPGFARWNGDAMPGVQVVYVGDTDFTALIGVGNSRGNKLGVAYSQNDGSKEANLDLLRQLAGEMGYALHKQTTNSKGNENGRNNNRRKKASGKDEKRARASRKGIKSSGRRNRR